MNNLIEKVQEKSIRKIKTQIKAHLKIVYF